MAPQKRVLIVDDAPDIVAVLSALFEVEGFSVVTAQSANEGLTKYRDTSARDLIQAIKTQFCS